MRITREIQLPSIFLHGIPCVGKELEQILQALEAKYVAVKFIPAKNRFHSADLLYVVTDQRVEKIHIQYTERTTVIITNPSKDFELLLKIMVEVLTELYEDRFKWLCNYRGTLQQ